MVLLASPGSHVSEPELSWLLDSSEQSHHTPVAALLRVRLAVDDELEGLVVVLKPTFYFRRVITWPRNRQPVAKTYSVLPEGPGR